MRKPILSPLLLITIALNTCVAAAWAQGQPAAPAQATAPKYGTQVVRLFDDPSWVRQQPAPDYWAIAPYYVHQENGKSCSVASVAMIVNAARANSKLSALDELATHAGLMKRVPSDIWRRGVDVAVKNFSISLDHLGDLTQRSLEAYGIKGAKVEVVRPAGTREEALKALRQALKNNERSSNDFIIANFVQSELTGDPEGSVGHVSPVGAYDAQNDRVLIMDPDRTWYEPYWVPTSALLAGMLTIDQGYKRTRGYVVVTVRSK